MAGNLVPPSDNGCTLGTPYKRWKKLYTSEDVNVGTSITFGASGPLIKSDSGSVLIRNSGDTLPAPVIALLQPPAGTTEAGTAPIKLTSGPALTTPESGVFEFYGSHLYFTIGSTRHRLDIDTGTPQNTFLIGDGASGNKTISANTAASNKPSLRYNDSTDKWEYTNDGVTWNDIGSGAGGAPTVDYVTLDFFYSDIGTPVSSTKSIPANAKVLRTTVLVDGAFTGGADPTCLVEVDGEDTDTTISGTSQSNLGVSDQYTAWEITPIPSGQGGPVRITLGGTASAGSGSVVVEFATGVSTGTDAPVVKTIAVPFGFANIGTPVISSTRIPENAWVDRVVVITGTAFTGGAAPTCLVEIVGSSVDTTIASTDQVNLEVVGQDNINDVVIVPDNQGGRVRVTLGGTAAAGAGKVYVAYSTPDA